VDGTVAFLVVGDDASQGFGGGLAQVLLRELPDPAYARVVAGGFDLVRHVQSERNLPYPRSPDGVDPYGLQYLPVLDAELPPS